MNNDDLSYYLTRLENLSVGKYACEQAMKENHFSDPAFATLNNLLKNAEGDIQTTKDAIFDLFNDF